jgi:serine protease AprX
MDSVRPTSGASRRTGSLLALALAAAVVVPGLAPVTAADAGAAPAPLVEVVVTSTSEGVAAVTDAVRAAGGTVLDALPLAGGVSAELPAGAVLAPSFTVVDNAPITLASSEVASPGRKATAVREALGLGAPAGQGAGVLIAVVDTGVAEVRDLAGRLTPIDVSGSWEAGEPRDAYGHGTFVAGVAAGDGSSSGGRYAGVAPGARVLDVRVADQQGRTDLATVLAGLQAADAAGADVVNLSLSSGSPLPYQLDPLTVALTNLWRSGTVVVVPTGNDGPRKGSVTSPGSDPTLLTVGALDERTTPDRSDDTVPDFSGRGPAPQDVAKPELVAPGTSLVSLRAPGSAVDSANPGSVLDEDYFRGSGTSFATAAVSGAAAVLLADRPELEPDQVKALVRGTAYSAKGMRHDRDAGSGGLDLTAALARPAPAAGAPGGEAPPAGDEQAWHAFLQALMDGDRAAAAAAWDRLSPASHTWAAQAWASHKWASHKWASDQGWSSHKWAGNDASAQQWELRMWASHKWASHKWAGDSFISHKWASHTWADEQWASHKWASHKWASHKWASRLWAASSWS